MSMTSVCGRCGAVYWTVDGHTCDCWPTFPQNASGPAADDSRARKWKASVERNFRAQVNSTHRQDAAGTPVTPRKRLAALRAEIARLEKDNADLLERARRAELYGSAYARTIAARAAMDAGHLDPAELGLPCAAAGPGDTLEVPRPAGLAKNHPESLVTGLNPDGEDELDELRTELWPNDEYLGITADGPGAS